MAPLVLGAAWYGDVPYILMVFIVGLLGLVEWMGLIPGGTRQPMMAICGGFLGLVCAAALVQRPDVAAAIALGAFAVVGLTARRVAKPADRWLLAVGIPYVGAGLVALVWLRMAPGGGLFLLIFALFTVWATDIGAYAAGRTIGGPKLAPRISPKKTWAGLIGGMAASALVGWGLALAIGAQRPGVVLLVGAVIAVVGQAGDLFESWAKRRYDVKDSGTLIPGHGGVLDRIDGLLVAAPVLALFHATVGARLAWW